MLQLSHALAPVKAANFPGRQLSQGRLASVENFPRIQRVHTVLFAEANNPTPHFEHSEAEVRPVRSPKGPLGHSPEHIGPTNPVRFSKRPFAHGTHAGVGVAE